METCIIILTIILCITCIKPHPVVWQEHKVICVHEFLSLQIKFGDNIYISQLAMFEAQMHSSIPTSLSQVNSLI